MICLQTEGIFVYLKAESGSPVIKTNINMTFWNDIVCLPQGGSKTKKKPQKQSKHSGLTYLLIFCE